MTSASAGSSPKVFISYRRSDSGGHAGRLYDTLVARLGEDNIFMDVDLQPGVDFVERIKSAVAACHVLLVVIGPHWARPAAAGAPSRLEDPDDFVRLEVATALRRSDVIVIPLLVEEAEMPDPDDLPENLRALARRNALELSDTRWRTDVARLMEAMQHALGEPVPAPAAASPAAPAAAPAAAAAAEAEAGAPPPAAQPQPPPPSPLRRYGPFALAALALVVVVVLVLGGGGDDEPRSPAGASTAAAPSTAPAAETDRPAGVPAGCTDEGHTRFAGVMEARTAWVCNDSLEPAAGVHGESLDYFVYRDAADARAAVGTTAQSQVDNGLRPCPSSPPLRDYDGEVACHIAPDSQTIELLWHPAGQSVVGHSTFDPPTRLPAALREWARRA